MNKYEEVYFSDIVKKSNNLTDICRKLDIGTTKGNRDTVKKYIIKYGLDKSHFKSSNSRHGDRKELSEILVENSEYTYTTNLKHKLYKEGIKGRICELCGQDENWNGSKMSLILDHINGINNDNRIENLRIVCPNCNATLETHCRGNKIIRYRVESKINKCNCGEIIYKGSNNCKKCYDKIQRKVERPLLEELIKDIELLGYSATGRKYGVSDNAIRKWLKTT